MSIHTYMTKSGKRYVVKWRDAGGTQRSKSFASKSAANKKQREIDDAKESGSPLPSTSKRTLGEYVEKTWWPEIASVAPKDGGRYAIKTQELYSWLYLQIEKTGFQQYKMRDLANDPRLFYDLVKKLKKNGASVTTQRKCLMLLQAIFRDAVSIHREVASNPVKSVEKPKVPKSKGPNPLSPYQIEHIRSRLNADDAYVVALLGMSGMRPGEAMAATLDKIGRNGKLRVDDAMAAGEARGQTKTGRVRHVPVMPLLREEIDAAMARRGETSKKAHLLLTPRGKAPWSDYGWNNWTKRVWRKAVDAVADYGDEHEIDELSDVRGARAYDLRASYVSLRLNEGVSPIVVASETGHNPQVMWDHYGGEINLDPTERIKAEDAYRDAREKVAAEMAALEPTPQTPAPKKAPVTGWAGLKSARQKQRQQRKAA